MLGITPVVGGAGTERCTGGPYSWLVTTGRRGSPVIDLHTHSTISDGTDSPADLVAAAAQAGIDVLALTDHDTVGGWAEAVEAAPRHGLTLVRGIEVSCTFDHATVHLLGYLPDPGDSDLSAALAHARESRATRLERMVERMAADGIPVTYEEVLAQVGPGTTPGRPHIADALIANGTIRHRDEAFREWLTDESPYYVEHWSPDPVRAVELVRAAGGASVIAHPFTRTRTGGVTDELLEQMADAGLVGIEAFHRDHGPEEVARAARLATRLDLVLTGSSDYHGTGKRNRLAENTTTPEALAVIEAATSGVIEVVRP